MKKLKRLASILCTLFLLTGCFKMEMNFEVKSAEELKINAVLLLSPQLTAEMGDEDMAASMKEQNEDKTEAKYENIEKEVNGEIWKGVSITADVPEEEISKYLKIEDNYLVFTMTQEEVNNLTSDGPMGGSSEPEVEGNIEVEGMEELGNEMLQAYKASGAEMKINVTMPKEPTTNIGVVNGKTVTIDLLSDDYLKFGGEKIIIKCQNSINYMDYLPIACVGALCLFCIIGIIVVNSREE